MCVSKGQGQIREWIPGPLGYAVFWKIMLKPFPYPWKLSGDAHAMAVIVFCSQQSHKGMEL